MKATVTFRQTDKIGVDEWETYTIVVHLSPSDTIDMVNRLLREKMGCDKLTTINVELHLSPEEGSDK